MQVKSFLFILCFWSVHVLHAQISRPTNGVNEPNQELIAITNAHIIVSPTMEIKNGTLLIKNNIILNVGASIEIPKEAQIFDIQGAYIYPAFIELNSSYGLPPIEKRKKSRVPQYVSEQNELYYWNDAIHPQVAAATEFTAQKSQAEALKKNGFGLCVTHFQNGIMRGSGALVNLNPSNAIIKSQTAAFYGLGKGNSSQSYPTSQMGSIALFRQAQYNAAWYSSQKNTENISLAAINTQNKGPQIFCVSNFQEVATVAQLNKEFGLNMIAQSGGDDYQRIADLKSNGTPLIIPLDFPKPFEIDDPLDAEQISLAQLKHWELAPYNPAILSQNDIPFAFTASKNPKDFIHHLRTAVANGLEQNKALAALTTTPASYIGMQKVIGSLEKGKQAHFFISNGNFFQTNAQILENWSNGQRTVFKDATALSPQGQYNLNVDGSIYSLTITPSKKGYTASSTFGPNPNTPQKAMVTHDHQIISFVFTQGSDRVAGPVRFVGKMNYKGKIIDGKAQDGTGKWVDWTAIKQLVTVPVSSQKAFTTHSLKGAVFYPNGAYGDTILPEAKNYFISHATIWTCDSLGNFEGDVIIEDGRISLVGKYLTNPGYEVIEGNGLHVTPGIIDEHSHIAIRKGVNEAGQNNSAEVRIGDVLNPNDINIYRQLAGGVTTAQLLHGSANPIGGQSQVIKLKWGQSAEGLKFKEAPGSIKFALGENVKQSNWGDYNTTRFPQTRMGVEQVYFDAFIRAKAYQEAQLSYQNAPKKEKKNGLASPRKDLELEALVEILNNKRFITCHSYVKTEINMLMDVADSMGFQVNTFTHILEGYKVANEMKNHGVNASTFSDWWAYKFEVNDAIPYNAAILQKSGVNVGINSDDAEMARRLNQEAAKTIKYGGMTEIQALNMITINPAKMLHIDHLVGSITVGKSADLVIWNGPPLSVYSRPVFTMIEGTIYYSATRDTQLQLLIEKERQRIIRAMMKAKENGATTQPIVPNVPKNYHCDSFDCETHY